MNKKSRLKKYPFLTIQAARYTEMIDLSPAMIQKILVSQTVPGSYLIDVGRGTWLLKNPESIDFINNRPRKKPGPKPKKN